MAQPYTVANCLTQRMHKGINTTLDEGQTPVLAHALRGEGFDAGEDGTGRGTPIVPVHAFDARQSDVLQYGDKTGPLDTDGHSVAVLAFQPRIARNGRGNMGEVVNALQAQSGQTGKGDAAPCVATGVFFAGQGAKAGSIAYNENLSPTLKASDTPSAHIGLQVRRLTPRECERLQGFPDDYTAIRWRGRSAEDCPDGPRYKALGNSWAVPVVHWIGARIQQEVSK